MLYRVEVEGFEQGPVDRHGCPSHGIGLTPDESEIWVSDGHNSRMHVFDATVMPPRQIASLQVRYSAASMPSARLLTSRETASTTSTTSNLI